MGGSLTDVVGVMVAVAILLMPGGSFAQTKEIVSEGEYRTSEGETAAIGPMPRITGVCTIRRSPTTIVPSP